MRLKVSIVKWTIIAWVVIGIGTVLVGMKAAKGTHEEAWEAYHRKIEYNAFWQNVANPQLDNSSPDSQLARATRRYIAARIALQQNGLDQDVLMAIPYHQAYDNIGPGLTGDGGYYNSYNAILSDDDGNASNYRCLLYVHAARYIKGGLAAVDAVNDIPKPRPINLANVALDYTKYYLRLSLVLAGISLAMYLINKYKPKRQLVPS